MVIGGGAGGVPSRFARRGGAQDPVEAAQLAAAMEASMGLGGRPGPSRADAAAAAPSSSGVPGFQNNEEDFPSVGPGSVLSQHGASSGRWAGAVGGAAGGASLHMSDFPSLPGECWGWLSEGMGTGLARR